ncbi:hypothetical protein GIB67_017693, partial [Kingdonia uniflora]
YCCKKHIRVVAAHDNVVEHTPGEKERVFKWQKRKTRNSSIKTGNNECSLIFVEPLQWMTTVEEGVGVLEGKLYCVGCNARLGYFNWSGIQCSCGSWITPAFQLQQGRLQISKVLIPLIWPQFG